ncbi:MAG: APC family permease [Eggerthellaceae bacterium]|jgi:amino acid transporter|nr:APC family permease [Eggerthellaceae bacterium]
MDKHVAAPAPTPAAAPVSAPAASAHPARPASAVPAPAPVDDNLAAAPPTGAANGGFKRTLTVFDLVIYGLISMVPIAPFSIYASVFNASHGMPALTYLIALGAMLFTVLSFGVMINRFPSSGSIYTYATKGIGKLVGFVAGWLMLLQYLVGPTLCYIMAGLALNQYVPAVPVWGWCLMFLAFTTFVALRGMKTTIAVNRVALVGELLVLALFLVLGVAYVIGHPATSGFSATAFVNPSAFNFGDTMGAVSLAAFSYVGFGCVATLTQEAKDGKTGPSRAMMIMILLLGAMFVLTCFVATCVDPTGAVFAGNEDNGFYLVAQMVAGPWLGILCAVAVALAQGVFTGMVFEVSIVRVLYVMGRGGSLPRVLGRMDEKTGVPVVATLFVSGLSLAILPALLCLGMDEVAKVSNFGALSTYLILNCTVIWYYWVRQKDHSNPWRLLVCPLLGMAVTLAVLASLSMVAHLVGIAWIVIGVAYYLVTTRVLRRDVDLGDAGA